MSAEKENQDLIIVRQLEALDGKVLPAEYRPSSSEVALHTARQAYYERADLAVSYSELANVYNRASTGPTRRHPESAPDASQVQHNFALSIRRFGDALVEYREQHGLDKLREKIITELVNNASFEKGISFLADHIREQSVPLVERLLLRTNEPSAQQLVERVYPDLNAEEVSWLALVEDFSHTEMPWIGDVAHHQFYPPSLVGMDQGGLIFSSSAEEIEDHGRLNPESAEELTGVTGRDRNVYFYPFRHNVAEGIKALITLSLNEADIFEQVRNDEAVISMLQGDSLLIARFVRLHAERFGIPESELHLKISELVSSPKNSLTNADIPHIRQEALDYLLTCSFFDTKGQCQVLADVVKLFGMAERLPAFVLQREPFAGSVLFYSGALQFINLEGQVVDSIPLVEHLLNRFGYKFRDQVDQVGLRTKVTRALFDEICDRIQKVNIESDSMMHLDRLQMGILLKHGIAIPVETNWKLETTKSFGQLYKLKSANDSQFRKYIKFGAFELEQLTSMLDELPPLFTKNVTHLRKGSVVLATESVLTTGQLLAGFYEPSSKAVVINVPEFGPTADFDYLSQLLAHSALRPPGEGKKREIEQDQGVLLKLQHNFFHTVVHEFAESVAALLGDDLVTQWMHVEPLASAASLEKPRAKRRNPREIFVSSYAMTDPKEDFCECCAVYFLAGDTFRQLAKDSPVLAAKYEFMRRLFSYDKTPREYPNRYSHNMYDVVGDPALPHDKILQDHFAVQFIAEESRQEHNLRDRFSSSVVSFEDVADVIADFESKGIATTREAASEIALQEQRERGEAHDEMLANQRIFLFVNEKMVKVAQEYGIPSHEVETKPFEVIDAIYNGDSKALRGLLVKSSGKKIRREHSAEMIKRLRPLVKEHSQAIDAWRSRIDDAPDVSDRIAAQIMAEVAKDLEPRRPKT